jgi:hypothetical protein
MINYTIYEKVSGRPIVTGCTDSINTDHIVIQPTTEIVHVKSDLEKDYLLDNIKTERPLITSEPNKLTLSTDNVDSIVIQDLPLPCTIKVNETAYEVNDGEFEFTTDTVGTFTVTVEQFPYITKSWEIEAV